MQEKNVHHPFFNTAKNFLSFAEVATTDNRLSLCFDLLAVSLIMVISGSGFISSLAYMLKVCSLLPASL